MAFAEISGMNGGLNLMEGNSTVGMGMVLDESFEVRFVTLRLSRLACEALDTIGLGVDQDERRLEVAIRFYLRDEGQQRPAWPYPGFLRGSEIREEVEMRLGLAADLWRAFEAMAARQGVSVAQLSEHVAFYLAAELDAGRITRRILAELATDAE